MNAQILNGSFEQADSNDPNRPLYWQIDPNGVLPEILQSFSTDEQPYPSSATVVIQPIDGQHFILLRSDSRELTTNFSRVSQKITAMAGQRIAGAYFFSTGDYTPYNDTATIKLIPDPCSNPTNLDEILLAEKSVAEVGSYQTMLNWDRFIHDFNDADAGTYTLVLQIEDAIDHIFTSRLAVDAVQILTAPPLPSCIYTLAGDINRDCKVDFIDFAMMAENWLIDCNITPDNTACISPDPQ